MTNEAATQMMVEINKKSLAVGIILTWFLGGVGLFYASILGGVIMLILELAAVLVTLLTFGLGIILFIPLHLISFIWVVLAINQHNARLAKGLGTLQSEATAKSATSDNENSLIEYKQNGNQFNDIS